MHLRISNHNTNQFSIYETHDGTYVDLKENTGRLEVSPFSGVSLITADQTTKDGNGRLFLPCKFSELRVEGEHARVLLSGINSKDYSVRIDGCNNSVIFTCESNIGCVNWEETGSCNVLDVSQQENTHTQGKFSPTTNIITKSHILPSCKICDGVNRANVLVEPCGHLGICDICSQRVFNNTAPRICPFCRCKVERLQTLYVA